MMIIVVVLKVLTEKKFRKKKIMGMFIFVLCVLCVWCVVCVVCVVWGGYSHKRR